MTNKYNARKVHLEGFVFDSIIESKRYQELKLLLRAGEIELLEVHPKFEIIKSLEWNGEVIKATHYEADFQYWDCKAGRIVVEDVKGFDKKKQKFIITAASWVKIKLFVIQYPQYEFRIV